MNERIKELAEQFRMDFSITQKRNQDGIHWDNVDEFAELIIKESIIDFYRRYLDTTSNEDITVQVERYIKNHFGVE